MQIHRIAHLDDLVESAPRRFVLGAHAVALTKLAGEPHAIEDACPHDGASLSSGTVDARGVITCPVDGRAFSLHDGRHQGGSDERLVIYATRLTAENWVEVEVP